MLNDEAAVDIKPRSKIKNPLLEKIAGRRNIWIAGFLLLTVTGLCISNYFTYKSYKAMEKNYQEANAKISLMTDQYADIQELSNELKGENEQLKVKVDEVSAENQETQKKMDEIQKQNQELVNKNRELVDDNVALQNSLKMAAAVGIKPQNYAKYSGLSSRSDLDRGTYMGSFLGTAYTPSKDECGNDSGITYSGMPIVPGISLAVDTNYWPFGTVFYIKGLGYAVAMDTGSAIKGKQRFDFAVLDKSFAAMLGQKYWDVYLVKMGDGSVNNISF